MKPIIDLNVLSAPWAMGLADVESTFDLGVRAYERRVEQAGVNGRPSALQAYQAARAERGKLLGVRGETGILRVNGPLFKRETWLTTLLGARNLETRFSGHARRAAAEVSRSLHRLPRRRGQRL